MFRSEPNMAAVVSAQQESFVEQGENLDSKIDRLTQAIEILSNTEAATTALLDTFCADFGHYTPGDIAGAARELATVRAGIAELTARVRALEHERMAVTRKLQRLAVAREFERAAA